MRATVSLSLRNALGIVLSTCLLNACQDAEKRSNESSLFADCQSSAASIYEAPNSLDHQPGALLGCSTGVRINADDADSISRTAYYDGPTITTGFDTKLIQYATTRGDSAGSKAFSSAVILWPTELRAAKVPVIVIAHGTVGQAPNCPPSRESPSANETYLAELAYPLAGAGYAVIVTDYAGYAAFGSKNNPPAGYHAAKDEAYSVLDAARALRNYAPNYFTDDVVLVGHSQGGHAVISALTLAESYGAGGHLAGVVALAPSWFTMASFGAMLAVPEDYTIKKEANAVAASVWYHYTHAELLDGPGKGPLLFAPENRAKIKDFVETACWYDVDKDLSAIGSTIADLFDPSFSDAIAISAGLGGSCTDEPCATWMQRYADDRPHLEGSAKDVPLLMVYGDIDDWIPADRAKCGFDRLIEDGANLSICIVPGAKHDPVVGMRADYVNRWIAYRTLDEPAPTNCGGSLESLVDESGYEVQCAKLPPN